LFLALGFVTLVVADGLPMEAADAPQLVASASPDWPQWRGPRRDGVSTETGLLPSWPAEGPKRQWTLAGLGQGYCSPIVVGENVYITGDEGNDLIITALNTQGERRWQVKNGAAWRGPYPGARAACCYDDGKLYHMNAHGRLVCLEAATGKELWAVDTLAKFKGQNITWGISEAVLVDGDRVFATPSGSEGLMVALDKRSGETLWATPAIEGEEACYSSPILLSTEGKRVLVNCGRRHAFAIDAADGKLLWKIAHVDPKNTVATTPVLVADRLVFTNSSRSGGGIYGTTLEGARLWTKELTASHGSLVGAAGRVVGGSSRGDVRGWMAIDPATGDAAKVADLPVGSSIYADGRFYCLSERGEMMLQELTAEGFVTRGQFKLADGRDVWAHPVICHGRLYLRYADTLYCYEIGKTDQ
jgi:outer membrane protein assembly factor BamB